ncbi:hypothetical protein F0L17_14215 [Streptomyces sp. TRM43335]|uniref:Uncharacterized protein n=1 Tax=Streptomyces taklimakanensis TaxID=2569853 RepID=A0A6G2BEB1_9ACTN|nr:helix-turn-helix domain-containing protein [Streptomyces taklimakanensis]MTE20242.1 hypothetical protein [Streptomyces taklimakanensis]
MPAPRHPRITARTRAFHDTRPLQITHTPHSYDDARDIDWIAVERAAQGTYDPTALNLAEKREAVLLMDRNGYTACDISERLSVYRRQIARWRSDSTAINYSHVERATQGTYDPTALNPAEKREAVLLMLDHHHTEREISEQLDVHPWEIRLWKRQQNPDHGTTPKPQLQKAA